MVFADARRCWSVADSKNLSLVPAPHQKVTDETRSPAGFANVTRTRQVVVLLAAAGLLAAACGSTAATELVEPSRKAGVNVSVADVALSDVVFDTFDGGSITLEEASASRIEGLLDAIPPLDEPRYEPGATTNDIAEDDLVIGVVASDGSAWAYPHRILNLHEIVNDEFDGVPVLVTYCPLCRSGVVFDRRIDDLRHDGVLTFGNSSALYENDLVLVDRQTNSYWWQLAGRSIVGDLSGAELDVLPSVTTTWGQWLTDHPQTQVLSHDQGFGRDYTRDSFTNYAQRVDAQNVPFPVGPGAFDDDRLSPSTRVIGFEATIDGELVPHAVAVLANEPVEVVVRADPTLVVRLDGNGGGEVVAQRVENDGTVSEVAHPSRSAFWFAYVAIHEGSTVELVGPPR